MSFDIFFATLHACPLYYANKIEIHIKKIIGIQPCRHSHKMFHKTKDILHEKIWVLPYAPWCIVVQMEKKNLTKMVNVYGLLVVVRK
jgi:hypothetical protein